MHSHSIARALAAAYLVGSSEPDVVADRWRQTLSKRYRWLLPLAIRVVQQFANSVRPRKSDVTNFIIADESFQKALLKHEPQLAQIDLNARPLMKPVAAAQAWQLPAIHTAGELAHWLDVDCRLLDWFADLRSSEANQGRARLRHYHYRTLEKRFGRVRLIESPKPRLKRIQRCILTGILDRIPPHPATHGFRRGRSILTFCESHFGQRIVLKIDLQDFFPSVLTARVQATFRTAGYPEEVADLLGGLCTNAAPRDIWTCIDTAAFDRQIIAVYLRPHLPQGAPTSPALANLCAYRLDCRLAALARSAAARYTRYADDIAFSGGRDFERSVERFQIAACATIMEEGFLVHHRKTRLMRQGVRQHLAGLVLNERLSIRRFEFDRFKATLTNCVRHGPDSQNRIGHHNFRSHLEGRLSYFEMVNPSKSSRLRKLFEEIQW